MTKTAVVIGSGIGGLGTACLLGKAGWDVTVIEKNDQVGGRAGVFEASGFRFDTGPSWYLMPDVFEKFFAELGENIHDHLQLQRLSPSYRVYFKDRHQHVDIYGDLDRDRQTFESIEPGAGAQLDKYIDRSSYVYQTAMDKFLYKNYDSFKDFLSPSLALKATRLSLLSNMDRYVRKYFKDPRLQQLMQYQLVFLGASPYNAPALYNLMSHVDYKQGVFYPKGGIYELIKALHKIAKRHGVKFRLNTPAEKIILSHGKAVGVVAGGKEIPADAVISNADIHHTENALLPPHRRDHSESYWGNRVLAPSALLLYLGVSGRYPNLQHHNLVFCKDWANNFSQIYDQAVLPTDPSFYVCAPSRTDPTVAPKGKENLFVLVPIPAATDYSDVQLDEYADQILDTMESVMDLPKLRHNILYKRMFSAKDFESRYNSFGGSGLGLAHTLRQTAIFRPSNQSKKVRSLYYVGANVHPGIGLPVCLISSQLAANRIAPIRHSSS